MPIMRQNIEIAQCLGLNLNSEVKTQQGELRGGYNFQDGRDGFIERVKGSTKALIGTATNPMQVILDIYYHQDITDTVIALGLYGSIRKSTIYINGTWMAMFKNVNMTADVAAGATTIYVDSTSGLTAGSSIILMDATSTETKTILSVTDSKTINFSTGTTNAYSFDLGARISINSEDAAQAQLHLGGLNDWASYLKRPVWCGGGDLFIAENLFQTINGVAGVDAFSLNDINRSYYRDNGGNMLAYIPIVGNSICVAHDRLWLAGDSELENIVMYTQKYNLDFYDIGQGNVPFLNYLGISGDSSGSGSVSDRIVKIIPWNDDILVLKGRSLHKIIGDTSANFQSVKLSDKIGCDSRESVVSTKQGIVWKDGENVWLYNGQIQNLSVPRVSRAIASAVKNNIRAGCSQNRFYLLTINDYETWRYDLELGIWSFEDVNYQAFTSNGGDLYAINRAENAILLLDQGYTREANADGTGGTAYDFLVEWPLIDCGTRTVEKIFCEASVFALMPDSEMELKVDFDGRAESTLYGSSETGPIYQEADTGGAAVNPRTKYQSTDYNRVPLRQYKFDMPLESRCYAMAPSIKKVAPVGNIRIASLILSYIPCASADQEDGNK